MPIGVALDGMIPIGEMVELARGAEERGVGSLWMAEHMGYRDAVSAAMAFLASTARLTVVPTAISVYARHPMIAAMTAATLEEAAPGRTLLTLASGNPRALGEVGVAIERPVTVMREYVRALRALWAGGPVTLKGDVFRLQDARLHLPTARPIPIYLAAMGPRMLELAGELGDGVVLSAGLSPLYIRHSLARVAEGARCAGRDPRQVTAAGFVLTAVARDGARARREAKKMLAYLFRNRFIAENLAVTGTRVDRAAAADAAARGDWDTAVALLPDEVATEYAIAGTLAECRSQLDRFRAAGLDMLVLMMVGDAEARQLALDLARSA
ncbi:MAG TPA: LLM class flavin-dependent oxidoreductase [Methylomirabilota bacterium]|nr:LLM class flavin-dependent oxidoreductase [Methylomirabilota bacterium]